MVRGDCRVLSEGLVVAAVVMLLASCSSTYVVPYPARWPALAASMSADCAAVAGRYRERGEYAEPSLALLSRLLFGFDPLFPDATHVVIQSGTDAMHVTVLAEESPLLSRSFSAAEGSYGCDDDGVPTIRTHIRAGGEGISGYEAATVRFSISDDYLTVRVVAAGRGSVMFVPARWSTDNWARFRKADGGD